MHVQVGSICIFCRCTTWGWPHERSKLAAELLTNCDIERKPKLC